MSLRRTENGWFLRNTLSGSPETVHAVRFAGVTTRSLYIEPDCVAACIKHRRCEVISVSPLLRQLLLEAVDLPPLYDSPRDRMLIQLMLLELAAMPVREFDIPLPQHPALLALCQAFCLTPLSMILRRAGPGRCL